MVTGLLLSILIARAIGPQEFGKYSVALTLGAFASIFIDGGFGRLLQREKTLPTIAIQPHQEQLFAYALGHAYKIMVVLIIVILLFSNNIVMILLTLLYFSFVSINQFSLANLRGSGHLVKDASWQIIYRLITLSILVAIITMLNFKSATEIIAGYCVSVLIFVSFISKPIRHSPRFDIPCDIYNALIPLVVIDLMATIYFKSDVLILAFLGVPKSQIGNYSAAFRFIEICTFIMAPVNLIIFRRLRLLKNNYNTLPKQIVKLVLISGLISFSISLILRLFGDSAIVLIYNSSYEGAKSVLFILTVAIFFVFPNMIMNQALFALDLEKYFAYTVFLAALISVGLNVHYIPLYGIYASAWITVVTEVFLFVCFSSVLLSYFLNKKHLGFSHK